MQIDSAGYHVHVEPAESMWDWDAYPPGADVATESGSACTPERAAAHILLALTALGENARATIRRRSFNGLSWDEGHAFQIAEVTTSGLVWLRDPSMLS